MYSFLINGESQNRLSCHSPRCGGSRYSDIVIRVTRRGALFFRCRASSLIAIINRRDLISIRVENADRPGTFILPNRAMEIASARLSTGMVLLLISPARRIIEVRGGSWDVDGTKKKKKYEDPHDSGECYNWLFTRDTWLSDRLTDDVFIRKYLKYFVNDRQIFLYETTLVK